MRLAPDDTVALERTGTALQIDEAALVPTSGGDVLVARSGAQLLRFDDPLGPAISMAELELGVTIHGPTFGGLFVGDPAELLDVPSGIARSTERFGALEPLAVTFLDATRAAAWFQIGAFTTTDGGKSWAAAEGGKPGVAKATMLATFGGVTGYGGVAGSRDARPGVRARTGAGRVRRPQGHPRARGSADGSRSRLHPARVHSGLRRGVRGHGAHDGEAPRRLQSRRSSPRRRPRGVDRLRRDEHRPAAADRW